MPVPITIYPSDDLAMARIVAALEGIDLKLRLRDTRLEARTAADWRQVRGAAAPLRPHPAWPPAVTVGGCEVAHV